MGRKSKLLHFGTQIFQCLKISVLLWGTKCGDEPLTTCFCLLNWTPDSCGIQTKSGRNISIKRHWRIFCWFRQHQLCSGMPHMPLRPLLSPPMPFLRLYGIFFAFLSLLLEQQCSDTRYTTLCQAILCIGWQFSCHISYTLFETFPISWVQKKCFFELKTKKVLTCLFLDFLWPFCATDSFIAQLAAQQLYCTYNWEAAYNQGFCSKIHPETLRYDLNCAKLYIRYLDEKWRKISNYPSYTYYQFTVDRVIAQYLLFFGRRVVSLLY